jgi:hypothetical protein
MDDVQFVTTGYVTSQRTVPLSIAQVGNGWIALKLGRVGCALVDLAFLGGSLISAWRRVHPRPVEFHCIV